MIKQRVKKFWEYINNADFDQLTEIMLADSNVILPNTKEIFKGCDNYIRFNKDYPGRWYARVEKLVVAGDDAISAVEITNDQGTSLYVTSFFKFEGEMIKEVTEYWGENGEAPSWRKDKGYSEII